MKTNNWLKRILAPSLLVAAAVFISGCSPSPEEAIEPHKADAKTQLERLTAVLDHCRELPPIEEDSPPEVEGVVFVDRHDRPTGNARTIWLDAHDGREDYQESIKSYSTIPHWWYETEAAISEVPDHLSKDGIERLLKEFEYLKETEYVLVIKTLEYAKPVYNAAEDNYNLGGMRGEAHLYRLSDAEHLGAVEFIAHNQSIGVGIIDLGLVSEDPESNVQSLKDRLYGCIHEFAQATLARETEGVDSIYEIIDGGAFLPDTIKNKVTEAENESESE